MEVIVVDGGSDDGETVDVLRQLSATWPARVRLFIRHGRHLVGDNRDYGITQAEGKYICCLDADDWLSPVYLEVALFLLENHAYDLVSTFIGSFGQSDEVFGLLLFPDLDDMTKANNVSTVGVFRKADWERSGGNVDTGLAHDYTYEDWRFWMRLAAQGARIANIEQPLFHYRRHGALSISNQSGSVVDMAVHRSAILEHNADVLTPEAFARPPAQGDGVRGGRRHGQSGSGPVGPPFHRPRDIAFLPGRRSGAIDQRCPRISPRPGGAGGGDHHRPDHARHRR